MTADVIILIAIAFANLPPGAHHWIFLITFFFLVLIGGLLFNQLNRENTIRKNRQIVITAISEKFETQRKACEELKTKSSNPSFREIQQIIQNIDLALAQLYLQYKACLQIAQSSIDKEVFEQVKTNFTLHTLTNQERLANFAQEINKFYVFLTQQKLISIFKDQSEPLMKQLQKMMEVCCLAIWTDKLNALKYEFDTFLDETVSKVWKTVKEIDQLKIRYNVEASLKDFGMKIQEYKRTIDQKESMLKRICKCIKEADTEHSYVLGTLPVMSNEEFLDFEDLKAQVDLVTAEAENGFQCK
jgi:hypothetical protein